MTFEDRSRARFGPRPRRLVVALIILTLGLPVSGCSTQRPSSSKATGARGQTAPRLAVPVIKETTASSPTPAPPAPPGFSSRRALSHIVHLSRGIGPRPEGSAAERRASSYISTTLKSYGYRAAAQIVRLPGGRTSRNVVVVKPGATSARFILGAHYDSKDVASGANDNASGVGVLLELARVLKDRPTAARVVFVFFGAEEMSDSNEDHHHYGSRQFVAALSPARRAETAGMLSVDMVGYGSRFRIRTMGKGPQQLVRRVRWFAKAKGVSLVPVPDPGRYGWSDHEAFELAGIPAAWIEWGEDPAYHTSGDVASRISKPRLQATGALLEKLLVSLSRKDLASLLAAGN